MNYEEKLAAIKLLNSSASVKMRSPGDWYLSHSLRILTSSDTYKCPTTSSRGPQEAIEEAWDQLTDGLEDGEVVHVKIKSEWVAIEWADGKWVEPSNLF